MNLPYTPHGNFGSPAGVQLYREATSRLKPRMNHRQKVCTGPCRRNRSVGQFAEGSDTCKTCVLRAPVASA